MNYFTLMINITHCRGRTWRRSCQGRSLDWRLRSRRWSRSPSGTRWRPGSRSCRAPRGSGRRTPATGHRSFLIGIVTIQILNKAFLQHPMAFLVAWQIQTSFKFICFYFFVTLAIICGNEADKRWGNMDLHWGGNEEGLAEVKWSLCCDTATAASSFL